jgi:hypothetical protein
MPGFTAGDPTTIDNDLRDFVKAVWPTVIKQDGGFANIVQTYQTYDSMQLLEKHETEDNLQFMWPVLVEQGPGGEFGRLGDEDSVSVQDNIKYAKGSMCHFSENVAWEKRELLNAQRNPKKMFDLLRSRKAAIQLATADRMEASLWGAGPSDSDDAETNPYSIPWWVQKDTGASGLGEFSGGNPSGFTDGAGGLSSTTHTEWQNWTAAYAAISDDDLIKKLDEAFLKMRFRAPGGHAKDVPEHAGMDQIHLFVNSATWHGIKKAVKDQNDSLGFDLDPAGSPLYRRRQFEYVPYLDADGQNPVYLIDMDTFAAHVLEGDFWRQTGPDVVAGKHNVIAVFYDISFQWVVKNRRRTGVICTT